MVVLVLLSKWQRVRRMRTTLLSSLPLPPSFLAIRELDEKAMASFASFSEELWLDIGSSSETVYLEKEGQSAKRGADLAFDVRRLWSVPAPLVSVSPPSYA